MRFTRTERQYHIGLESGEVAGTILLCGDPARARRIGQRLTGTVERSHREFVTVTGTLGGRPLSVMATGIGCDNTEIAVVELCRIVERPTLLRVGTCGAIASGIGIGELCISTGALRLESTSLAYVQEGYPALAHHEVLLALLAAASRQGRPFHVGITATAPGFYAAQGRAEDAAFPTRHPERVEELRRQGVINMEMECSTLFTLASLAGARAGAVCVVFANRQTGSFAPPEQREELEDRAIETALVAVELLARMDEERAASGGPAADKGFWLPESLRG